MVLEAIGKAGAKAGENVFVALDVASSEFWAGNGRYEFHKSGEPARDSEGMVALYADWCRQYPIISIEDGCAEQDWRGWAMLTKELGTRRAAGRRRCVRHQSRHPPQGHRRRRRQRAAGQAQSDRHGHRDARRDCDGQRRGLPQRDLAPLGRDRGFDDRRPRRGHRPPARSRPARHPAAIAWPSTTSCCGSRRSWVLRRSTRAAPRSSSCGKAKHEAARRTPS